MFCECNEFKDIMALLNKEKRVINYTSLSYEIFKKYKDEFELCDEKIEILNQNSGIDVDVDKYSARFMEELESDFCNGISSVFEIIEKPFHKDCDLQFDIKSMGISLRKIIEVKEKINEENQFLNDFTININKQIDLHDFEIIEREQELKMLEIFLTMKTKNNVLLTGKPGVGKTTLVEALAKKIVSGKIRKELIGKEIVSVDIARILANTKFRGEFEEKLIKILDIGIRRKYILFIDEAHIVIGAGASEGGISASNILKPYLLNNQVNFICATTEDEYSCIIKDKAFNRRFNAIHLKEFNENQMKKIGTIISTPYENYHNIEFSKNDIDYIIKHLDTEKYSEKNFPDKFIEFIDFIGSFYTDKGLLSRQQIDSGFEFYEKSRILIG